MGEILKIVLPIALVHIAILVVIVLVVKKMLLGDTMKAVDRIKQVEGEVRKKEEAIRKEIEEHEKDFVRKKAEAEADLQKRREDGEKELIRMKEQVVGEAKKEGDRILDQAKRNEEKMRQQIVQNMEEKIVEYAGQMFKLVFSEKMTGELDKQFIQELLEALQEVDSTTISVEGSQAEFTTCHPMDPEQKAVMEKLIEEKFGVKVKIQEKVEPELMAGVILKLGSLEIDGSLLSRYNEAAIEVKKGINL